MLRALIERFIDAIENTAPDEPFAKIYDIMKEMAVMNLHPELKFI